MTPPPPTSTDTLRAAIDVGINDLPAADAARYLQLAAFTGRGPFPATAVAALWHPLSELQTHELLVELVGRSLLTVADTDWYIAHDLQYDTVTQRLGSDQVRAAHAALLDGYQARRSQDWTRGGWPQVATGDHYLARNLAGHLAAAGRDNELVELLSRLAWMHVRITTASLPDLISDYAHATHLRTHAIRRALGQSARALTVHDSKLPALLASQLTGRLLDHPEPEIAAWAAALTPHDNSPWLQPLTPGVLTSAISPLELTLTGHQGSARGRTGGRKKKLKAYQVERARQMYAEVGDDGSRRYTVQQIADELGVKRTTVYGYLGRP